MTTGDWLEAELGQLYSEGVPLELRGGLNFVGLTVTDEGAYYTIEPLPGAASPTGATDSLQRNDGGSFGGTEVIMVDVGGGAYAGIVVANSSAYLALGASPSGIGRLRGGYGEILIGGKDSLGNNRSVIAVGDGVANDLRVGDTNLGSVTAHIKNATGYFMVYDGSTRFAITSAKVEVFVPLEMTNCAISETASVAQNGTPADTGWLRGVGNGTHFAVTAISAGGNHKLLSTDAADNFGVGDSAKTNGLFLEAKTGGQIVLRINEVTSGTFNASGLAMNSLAISGVTTLNSAAPVAPVEGTVLADANANIVATDGSQIRIPTLTGNRVYDINNTGAIDEEFIFLYRTGTEAFTATIRDNADATIATFPASTKLMGAFQKSVGGNFVFRGFQRIA